VLANNVIVGGGTAGIIVTSQSAFVQTPFPIVQGGIAALTTTIYSFANYTGFQGLNAAPWTAPPPTNVEDAINRMAALLQVLNGGATIP
jgi:hypothetical protein